MLNIMMTIAMRMICASAGQIARGMSAADGKLTKSVLIVGNDDYYDDDNWYEDHIEEDDVNDAAEIYIDDDGCVLNVSSCF